MGEGGAWTLTEADGDTITVAADGSWTKTEPDGDTVSVQSDGSWTKTEHDGDSVTVKTEGSYIPVEHDGKAEKPDTPDVAAKPNAEAANPVSPVQPTKKLG